MSDPSRPHTSSPHTFTQDLRKYSCIWGLFAALGCSQSATEAAPTPAPSASPSVLQVHALDVTGRPLADALSPDARSSGVGDGRSFEVRAGRSYAFTAPGHLPVATAVHTLHASTNVYLWPESTLSGRVVLSSTAKVGLKTRVRLWNWSDAATDFEIDTNEQGHFQFSRLPPGRYQLSIADPQLGGLVPVSVGLATHETGLELVAHRKIEVNARVVSEKDGSHCAAGRVEFVPGTGYWQRAGCACGDRAHGLGTATVEDNGHVSFFVEPNSVYSLRVSCKGMRSSFPRNLVVGQRAIRGRKWRLKPGMSRMGRVVSPDGRAVVDAEVWADADGTGSGQTAITDDQGFFELGGLTSTVQRLTITAQVDGRTQEFSKQVDLRAIEKSTEIIARWSREPKAAGFEFDVSENAGAAVDKPTCPIWPLAAQPLRGKVVDAQGQAIAGALVIPSSADIARELVWAHLGAKSGCRPTQSDPQGTFELLGYPQLPMRLVALVPGGGVGIVELSTLQTDIKLVVGEPATLVVDVRDARGKLARHLSVGDQHFYVPSGRLELRGLLPGPFALAISDTEERKLAESFTLSAGQRLEASLQFAR